MLFFYYISPTDMSYHGNVVLFILLLNQVTEGSEYNCSDFKGNNGIKHPLEECPPANFMLNDNLLECFDNYTKTTSDYYSKECLRLDFSMKVTYSSDSDCKC